MIRLLPGRRGDAGAHRHDVLTADVLAGLGTALAGLASAHGDAAPAPAPLDGPAWTVTLVAPVAPVAPVAVAPVTRVAGVAPAADRPPTAAPYADLSRRTLRLALSPADLTALRALGLGHTRDLPAHTRAALAPALRALTGRRFGLALGGAGAWGLAAIALIEALADRDVPVDIVAGTSSGALVGAYWCAAGRDGLDLLVARGPAFARAMPRLALSTAAVAEAVTADLGPRALEDLPTRLLPVATEMRSGAPVVFVDGALGDAVRASVSAPGIFAPTVLGGRWYADGAVADNAPYAAAEAAGADLVLVVNALTAPLPRARPAWSPLGRVAAFHDAFAHLLHRAGEPPPAPRRLTWTAAPAPSPLARTLRYDHAAQIVAAARRDPSVAATADRVAAAWRALGTPYLWEGGDTPPPTPAPIRAAGAAA